MDGESAIVLNLADRPSPIGTVIPGPFLLRVHPFSPGVYGDVSSRHLVCVLECPSHDVYGHVPLPDPCVVEDRWGSECVMGENILPLMDPEGLLVRDVVRAFRAIDLGRVLGLGEILGRGHEGDIVRLVDRRLHLLV